MPAITVEDLTRIDRLDAPTEGARERPVRNVVTAPHGTRPYALLRDRVVLITGGTAGLLKAFAGGTPSPLAQVGGNDAITLVTSPGDAECPTPRASAAAEAPSPGCAAA